MTADDPGDDPGRAARIRAKVFGAPRLSADTRARLSGLLDLHPPPAPRDPRSPVRGDISPGASVCGEQAVMSDTDGSHGLNAAGRDHDR